MKNNITKKVNNNGSTLVLVLVIVTFIAILGTVCISTAMLNLKMKTVDRESKKAFYTVEEAIDEIYTGLGKLSMEMLDDAYKEGLESITKQNILGDTSVSYVTTNTEANVKLRQNFTKYMITKMINIPDGVWEPDEAKYSFNTTYIDQLKITLNSYLENNHKASVESVDNIYIEKVKSDADASLAVYTIKFENCVVEYIDESGYFSHVTFNGAVALPDIVVQFTKDATNKLKPFSYALIGNSSIEIGQYMTLNITSNMYAGGSGLNLYPNSKLVAKDSTIVTSDTINLNGATLETSSGSSIWCTSIFAKKGKTSDTLVFTDSNIQIGKIGEIGDDKCKTYVKDDLQIDGDDSKVSIFGDYYGYSYEGDTVAEKGHTDSSAIIVNGERSIVDLSNISTLVIGGRAYIDFNGIDTPYMTGESLALKGDQEAYLLPGSFITNKITNAKLSNPFSNSYIAQYYIDNLNLQNFFGYTYLNESNPYKTVTVGNQVYVYLNFKSKADSANYFKAILNYDVFKALLQTDSTGTILDTAKNQAYIDTRNYMKSVVEVNFGRLLQTSIINTESAKLYTNGSLINADAGIETNSASEAVSNKYIVGGYETVDAFSINALDLKTRYSLISMILYTPDMYKELDGVKIRNIQHDSITNDIIIDGADVDISEITKNVFTNFINQTYLQNYILNHGAYEKKFDSDKNVMFATTDDITINNNEGNGFKDIVGGIIITTGDVTLEKNFNGLIMAGGKIVVNGNASVSNKIASYSNLDEFIDKDPEFKKFFKAWNPTVTSVDASGEITSIGGITYKNIVGFTGWEKTNDADVDGH